MTVLYDLITLFIVLLYFPVYLLKGKFHGGFLMRLGILPETLPSGGPIWVHAVSVGEVLAVRSLVEGLRAQYPAKKIIISTVTSTGNKIAHSLLKEGDRAIYFPLDFSFITKRVIRKIDPCLFIIAETEIWPNVIAGLNAHRVPIAVVNGRISDGSYKGYRLIRGLLTPLLNKIDLFCVQTQRDAQRLKDLGVFPDKIRVHGNMKFDTLGYAQDKVKSFAEKFRAILKLKTTERLIVAGSTHPGEEMMVLRAYKGLVKAFPGLRLLIAPRHPQRAPAVKELAAKAGFSAVLMTKLEALKAARDAHPVFILDTIGQLMYVYALAEIVFVGGSLVKKGGHNILEPAALGKPVFFGPYMFNFRDIADLFLNEQAGLLVHNETELKRAMLALLQDPAAIKELSARETQLIARNQGATGRNVNDITVLLDAKRKEVRC